MYTLKLLLSMIGATELRGLGTVVSDVEELDSFCFFLVLFTHLQNIINRML